MRVNSQCRPKGRRYRYASRQPSHLNSKVCVTLLGIQIQALGAEARVQDRRFLRTISSTERISRFGSEIPVVRRRGGAGQNESAVVRSDFAGAQASWRRHAAVAADVSGAGGVAHHLFPAGRVSRTLREIQRGEAHSYLAEWLDDALRLLRHRKGCLSVSGR